MSPRKRPSCDGAPRRNWQPGLPPTFWAFAWAGGLARYLLDHAEVETCDIDPFAFAAIRINAAANRRRGPSKTNLVGRDEGWDVVLAGEVC